MNSRSIGRLIAINEHGIIAEIFEHLGNYINTFDSIRFVGEVGSYVSVYDVGRTIIGEIIGVEEKPQITNQRFIKPNSSRLLTIDFIGEIVDSKFYFGVSKLPLIFSEVCIVSQTDLKCMLETDSDEEMIPNTKATRAKLLSIGSSVVFPDYKIKVNIDKFFGFHFAVFGNTGAGKSNTLAKIIQDIFKKGNYSAKGAKFVVIDSNGEYKKAFSEINSNNNEIKVKNFTTNFQETQDDMIKLEIPVWALSADDWAVLLHASEKTQIPILKRAIDIAKNFFDKSSENEDLKNHILASTLIGIFNSSDSSPSKRDKILSVLKIFNTDKISLDTCIGKDKNDEDLIIRNAVEVKFGSIEYAVQALTFFKSFIKSEFFKRLVDNKVVIYSMEQFCDAVDFATLYEGSISSQRIQEYTSTLVTRLSAVKEGIQGQIFNKTAFSNVDEYVNSIIGENQIANIDISNLDDASAEVVTKVLAKLLLDYLRKKDKKADTPINFIIEEAHRFIKNETIYEAIGYNIFERIAKEGRKYGLLLGISSQRPSELSKTIVSQCSNFIIHRIQSPEDLHYISRMVPYINQETINRLTYLQTGTALVFGSSINLPTLIKIEQANPKTDSDNAKISEKWYIK
jgi:hypothetical protein